MHYKTKDWLKISIIVAVLLAVVVISALFGSADISFSEFFGILTGSNSDFVNDAHRTIIMNLRMPRILLALVAGMGLAVAGVVFQGVFSNPMAEPYLLGISSGAAFGATLAVVLGVRVTLMGFGTMGLFAFAGAMAVVFMIFRVAMVKGEMPMSVLLLSGVAVNYFFSALIALMLTLNHDMIEEVYFWTMGSFRVATWHKLATVAIVVIGGFLMLYRHSSELDMLMLGDEQAKSLGVETTKVKKLLLATASLMTAFIVASSGIVGFVGLIVPHAARMAVGPRHMKLLPVSALLGGIFLVVCDTLARSLMANREFSIGIITSLFGVPFFLWHLYRNRKQVG